MLQLITENERLYSMSIASLIFIGGIIIAIWLYRIIKKVIRNQKNPAFLKVASIIQYPFKALILIIAINLLRDHLETFTNQMFDLRQLFYILFLAIMAWLGISIVRAIKTVIVDSYDVDASDNLKARKIHTQIRVFERIIIFLVLFITLALALLSFDAIRRVGISLLASAGIAGLIIGFAAQKSISMLLAGFQLALTQPIRLDDVVIVEGEWGKIEEITLTYVVVAIWDKRRLIVPVNYFIEQPFQNWTRQTSEILGTVFLYTDYGFPVDELRGFMTKALQDNPYWDGKVNVLQVTDLTEKSMQLRALASAKDSPSAWDLRVKLREDLIEFIRKNYPEYLPRTRINVNEEQQGG